MKNYRIGALDYVRHVMEAKQMTASALARAIAVSTTTLTRPLKSADGETSISLATLDKIQAYSKIDPTPFLAEGDNALSQQISAYRSHFQAFEPQILAERRWTDITGFVEAGVWRERPVLFKDLDTVALVVSAKEKFEITYCLRIKDHSVKFDAEPGSLLMCEELRGDLSRISNGDLVIVERFRPKTDVVELTARRVRIEKDGRISLWFPTDEPRFIDPIYLENTEEEIVSVAGYVTWILKPRNDTRV